MEFILFVFYEQLKNYVLNIFANYDFSNIDFKVAVGIISLIGVISTGIILIERLIHHRKKGKEKPTDIEKSISTNNNKTQSQQTISVTKKIGSPRIIEGIQQYENSDELPKFKELMASATETVDISGLSFTLMILQHFNVIKKY